MSPAQPSPNPLPVTETIRRPRHFHAPGPLEAIVGPRVGWSRFLGDRIEPHLAGLEAGGARPIALGRFKAATSRSPGRVREGRYGPSPRLAPRPSDRASHLRFGRGQAAFSRRSRNNGRARKRLLARDGSRRGKRSAPLSHQHAQSSRTGMPRRARWQTRPRQVTRRHRIRRADSAVLASRVTPLFSHANFSQRIHTIAEQVFLKGATIPASSLHTRCSKAFTVLVFPRPAA